MEIGLDERGSRGGRVGGWIRVICADVPQDCRVDPVVEASRAAVRNRANPVVVYRLIGSQDEGIPLAGI